MSALTAHEKDLLLMSLKNYLPMDVRIKVMSELPIAYNHWMGMDVMFVARNDQPKDRKVLAVEAQRKWIADCGGDEAGYVVNYMGNGRNTTAEEAKAIYRADAANLAALERLAGLI